MAESRLGHGTIKTHESQSRHLAAFSQYPDNYGAGKVGIVVNPRSSCVHRYFLFLVRSLITQPKNLAYKFQYDLQFINASSTMRFLHVLQCFLLLPASVYASIGPSADIHIANKFIQPDGFNRS